MMSSEVRKAIIHNDLETLKRAPLSSIDRENNSLVLLALCHHKFEVLQFLLSLNHFDLETPNCEGDTPLMIALTYQFLEEQFSLSLVEKLTKVNRVCPNKNTYLHLALERHFVQTARILIEKGADVNVQNTDGCTPFHMLFHTKIHPKGVVEGVGLMIYYGADATICDNNGSLPFDLAVMYDRDIIVAQENLLFYTFDSDFKYEMSNEVLFELLETRSSLVFHISEYVSEIVFLKNVFLSPIFFLRLEPEFLKVVIDKFRDVVRFCMNFPVLWYDFPEDCFGNFEMLMDSPCAEDTRQFITKLKIESLIEQLEEFGHPTQVTTDLIYYFLSHGIYVWEKDLEVVYKFYGYCQLFKTLLFMEIRPSNCDILPRVIHDVHFDLDSFLDDPHDYSINALGKLMSFFARPKIKKLCYKLNVPKLITRAETLPLVPLLVELARDACRKHLIDRFNVQKTSHFFTLLNNLPIGSPHRKILALEARLY